MKSDLLNISHIADSLAQIREYTSSGREQFFKTRLIQDGVVRNFEIIGEAAKRVSEDLKKKQAGIPWKSMSGLRDKLIHDYEDVNLEVVWDIIEKELPDLGVRIGALLKQMA